MGAVERVAHLIAPAPAGGAESVVAALAAASGDRARVVILNQLSNHAGPEHPFATHLLRRGVTIDEIRCGRRRYRAEVAELAECIRRHRIQVLHTHGYHATIVGYFAARRAGLPVVATVHGYLSRDWKERLYNVVDRTMLRRFDAVIAVSPHIRDQLAASGIREDRLTFVQNGMAPSIRHWGRDEARRLLNLGSDDPVIGWIGRLSQEKGADLFLQALVQTDQNVRAVVIGDGKEMPGLKQLAASLNLSNRVVFAGFRADAAELLPAFDALALTSRREGTPMVILEAVAAEIPIVAFSIGGIPDLLSDESAWLVAPEDVAALGRSMGEALRSPAERRRRAAAAATSVGERLSTARWVERVWAVYQTAVR